MPVPQLTQGHFWKNGHEIIFHLEMLLLFCASPPCNLRNDPLLIWASLITSSDSVNSSSHSLEREEKSTDVTDCVEALSLSLHRHSQDLITGTHYSQLVVKIFVLYKMMFTCFFAVPINLSFALVLCILVVAFSIAFAILMHSTT